MNRYQVVLLALAGPALALAADSEPEPTFVLRSPAVGQDGRLPVEFTGDGAGLSPPLEWRGAPQGTQSYAVVMHHVDPQQKIKWYWVLYHLPPSVQSLPKAVRDVGVFGTNSVNHRTEYAPPHSRGPGLKTYVLTVYALSAPPQLSVPPERVTRAVLLDAIQDRTLGAAELPVVYSRGGDDGRQRSAWSPADAPARSNLGPAASVCQNTPVRAEPDGFLRAICWAASLVWGRLGKQLGFRDSAGPGNRHARPPA